MFFDKLHDRLRRAGREDATLDDSAWVWRREMLSVRGQVDLQHYEGRLETVLGRAGYPVALELLTAAAVEGHLDDDTLDRYGAHFADRAEDGAPSVEHVLRVLEHDGYLERREGGYRFASGLLEDWWRGRYGRAFVSAVEPAGPGPGAGR